MPLGDSITWGVGSSTGNGYRDPLFSTLGAEGYVPDFVGSGRGGTSTNDLNQGYQAATAPDRLRALVDRIAADAPGVTVLLADLITSTSAPVVPTPPFSRSRRASRPPANTSASSTWVP